MNWQRRSRPYECGRCASRTARAGAGTPSVGVVSVTVIGGGGGGGGGMLISFGVPRVVVYIILDDVNGVVGFALMVQLGAGQGVVYHALEA